MTMTSLFSNTSTMKKNNGWPRLLREQPQLALYCDTYGGWDTFDGDAWALLLGKQPHFSEKCTLLDAWKSFGSSNWVALLSQQPQFASICEANNAWRYFNAEDWLTLLTARPEFEECCDKHKGWANLHVRQWVLLLRLQPHFSEKCNSKGMWLNFDGFDWVELLRGQPIFAVKSEKFGGWRKITDIGRWCELLEVCPQFANKCDDYLGWSGFDGFDWWRLLRAQPHFIEKCNEESGWEKIYRYCPSQRFVRDPYDCRYNDEVDGFWVSDFEPTAYKYPEEYVETFGRKEYWDRSGCGCWEESMLNAVGYMFDSDEHLNCATRYCATSLARVNKSFWIYTMLQIITAKSISSDSLTSLVKQCTGAWNWSTLSRGEWEQILCDGDCSLLNFLAQIVDEQFWLALEKSWPTWFNDAEAMRNARDKDDGKRKGEQNVAKHAAGFSAWTTLLFYHPEYAFACKDVKGWHSFNQDDWQRLLMGGTFLNTVERQVLDADFWFSLLVSAPHLHEICDANNGWSTLTVPDWFRLLISQPKFAEECHVWQQFDGEQWAELLSFRPELSVFCDNVDGWLKLNNENWGYLLTFNRSFIEKCKATVEKCKTTGAMAMCEWKSVEEVEKEFCSKQSSYIPHDFDDPAPDWREESGWNDMYGDADPSDFIEFR